ncbi:carbohydrate ABC transporter permease [Phaeobacter inhibens]|uniref:carbohydrate ABC transporter permease n=1 Tax=Phaeobacter inhibens TaxID=221822 RepID=UPI000163335C|nr:carbohydrate ABC transporter permease [Phaeobacter inhibens]AFO91639.1 ABC transporter, inner-membrane protein [Phaeobacter inhibens DSM 17395]AUQ46307.1 ABC transporter, inner-membrane protein [Phaeobacter inhibens]AXT23027.1 carbohydrate ABC transporter permease [Phaeobacter inhibens]
MTNFDTIAASGPKPTRRSMRRIAIYVFLSVAAAFFLMPIYIVIVTSLKTMPEIRLGNVLQWPQTWSVDAWIKAWDTACTGLQCEGIKVGFWNSMRILLPSLVVSITAGALCGYILTFWTFRGAEIFFAILLFGAFVPYQALIFPMIRIFSATGLYGTLPGIVLVHTIFGLPIMTLIFRNYYSTLPSEIFKAARVDGAGFFSVFWYVLLPISTPIIVVAAILQVTGIWNDYLLGLIFGGRENMPMTVQLNNIVNSVRGGKEYNVNMAATLLTALVPLTVYFVSGRWFVRGIAAGAVKG